MGISALCPGLMKENASNDQSNTRAAAAQQGQTPSTGLGITPPGNPIQRALDSGGVIQRAELTRPPSQAEIRAASGDQVNALDTPNHVTSSINVGGVGYDVGTRMDVVLSPNHGQGSSPKGSAEQDLFSFLPTIGKLKDAELPTNSNLLYIKGHLLNDNLGGKGDTENLFPITGRANADHERDIESEAKTVVNKQGRMAYYRVVAALNSAPAIADQVLGGKQMYAPKATFTCDLWPLKQEADDTAAIVRDDSNHRKAVIHSEHSAIIASTVTGRDSAATEDGNQFTDPTFDIATVQWAPSHYRGKAGAIWDHAFDLIIHHLADMQHISSTDWLTSLKGIGKAGAKAVVASMEKGDDIETFTSSQKATLTKARNVAKAYIEQTYAYLLTVSSDALVDGVAEEDAPPLTSAVEATLDPAKKTLEDIDFLTEAIDDLILALSQLHISVDADIDAEMLMKIGDEELLGESAAGFSFALDDEEVIGPTLHSEFMLLEFDASGGRLRTMLPPTEQFDEVISIGTKNAIVKDKGQNDKDGHFLVFEWL